VLNKLENKNKGKLHLSLQNFCSFCKYTPMFKTAHLSVSNFGFLSLCPSRTENVNFIPDSKTIPFPKQHSFNFGVRGKIDIPLRFSVWNGQSKRKPNFNITK
jgi:hypothetical protein